MWDQKDCHFKSVVGQFSRLASHYNNNMAEMAHNGEGNVNEPPADEMRADFLSLDVIDDDEEEQPSQHYEDAAANGRQPSNFHNESLPPWMDHYTDFRRINPLVALHNEIVGFCTLMEPHPEEMNERQLLVDKFKELVHETFGTDCQVDVFGSQATGLCLPTSDIDIAIIEFEKEDDNETMEKDAGNEQNEMKNWDKPTGSPLQRLGEALRQKWTTDLSYLEVIENTRVPLVKFTYGPTNISVDVCFNQQTGKQAAKLMKQYMDAMPPLRPLTFVLKYFMASRGLNQPYTGGVGSYLLQVMIVSFLQHRERDAFNFQRPSVYNLGALLVEFLELYSTDFNFITTGLSVRFDGFYFP
jgi:non-canonical poly(A) RNA polymerase PAPD5/7